MCCAEVSDSCCDTCVDHLYLSVTETSDSLWMTQKLVESLNSIHQSLKMIASHDPAILSVISPLFVTIVSQMTVHVKRTCLYAVDCLKMNSDTQTVLMIPPPPPPLLMIPNMHTDTVLMIPNIHPPPPPPYSVVGIITPPTSVSESIELIQNPPPCPPVWVTEPLPIVRKTALMRVLNREFQSPETLWTQLSELGHLHLWTSLSAFKHSIREMTRCKPRWLVVMHGQQTYRLAPGCTRHDPGD
jgi:hypothetical protein